MQRFITPPHPECENISFRAGGFENVGVDGERQPLEAPGRKRRAKVIIGLAIGHETRVEALGESKPADLVDGGFPRINHKSRTPRKAGQGRGQMDGKLRPRATLHPEQGVYRSHIPEDLAPGLEVLPGDRRRRNEPSAGIGRQWMK